MALTLYDSTKMERIVKFTTKYQRPPVACKYCGASEADDAIIYLPTQVCLDCALARGSDK